MGEFEPTEVGVMVPQARVGVRAGKVSGTGYITYRCHTCGYMIPKTWEVFFVDTTPRKGWASYIVPSKPHPTMTTHHDWHMAS